MRCHRTVDVRRGVRFLTVLAGCCRIGALYVVQGRAVPPGADLRCRPVAWARHACGAARPNKLRQTVGGRARGHRPGQRRDASDRLTRIAGYRGSPSVVHRLHRICRRWGGASPNIGPKLDHRLWIGSKQRRCSLRWWPGRGCGSCHLLECRLVRVGRAGRRWRGRVCKGLL